MICGVVCGVWCVRVEEGGGAGRQHPPPPLTHVAECTPLQRAVAARGRGRRAHLEEEGRGAEGREACRPPRPAARRVAARGRCRGAHKQRVENFLAENLPGEKSRGQT